MSGLFDRWTRTVCVSDFLQRHHYLGQLTRGTAWADPHGVIVLSPPTSRRLPGSWLELARWCIASPVKNAGSRQWAAFVRDVRQRFPEATTIVSYSDPAAGHTGALYRACNWWWAPTWHRLRPPPTGNGAWTPGVVQSVKDRWVFPLAPDPRRVELLTIKDEAVLRAKPWALYREPGGADFKRFASSGAPTLRLAA